MSKQRTRKTGWNRLLSGVLCLALALGLMPAAGLVQTAQAAHWADPYAEQLVDWGVMNSAADLRLDAEASRAEFVAMCNRAFGYKRMGGTPFTDVPSSAWYAQDIDIAYNAGYFKGTSDDTASPDDPLTREQAAVLIARNLVLQETVGESLGFTDSRELSEWSRGLIGAAVAEGMISGYPDGSFQPFNNITRGEVAAMLVRVLGNPIRTAGNYEMGDVYGNVVISSSNVTLRDTVILGNLYITGGVDLGNVLLENVTVLGRIVVSGGGESNAAQSSVILRNVAADELVVDSMVNQFVTISAYGLTDIPNTYVRSDTYLEDSSVTGFGLSHIELVGDSGTLLQLSGSIKEVVNKTPFSLLELVKGTAETITIDEYAKGSQLVVGTGTRVDTLNLDVATLVTGDGVGQGDIINLNIAAAGCDVDILPEHVEVRPGITATVDGDSINSTSAAELSSEPRLLAGYPTATSLRPTQAEGLFSGNKPGIIYWAVSAIADGSVSVENLINNPAYGGNILSGNSGEIGASARTEYGRPITGLEPDGSYYISAILVDARGNRSPLKVVSFTTPDDTVPAFVDGYPYLSKRTCEVAQVTAMANKSCQLYWVVLPAGAAAPTAQNFRTASFGGSYGYGSQSVAKNVPVSLTVNTTRLQENTYYDLYLWLNDYDGTMSSDVVHVTHESAAGTKFSFRTPDETAPIVTNIEQSDYNQAAAAAVTFTINEAPADLYWAVVTESDESFITADMTEQRKQLKVEFGTGAIVSGKKAAVGANVDTVIGINEIKGLDYATYGTHSFKLYYVAKDAEGNYSEVKYIEIHTLDADPPHAWLEFSDAVNGSPRANSDIRIVFDEQVKGGANATQTFLDYYETVKNAAGAGGSDQSNLNAAKSALATELDAHFKLYYSAGNSLPQPVAAGGMDTRGDSWVIDWREAVITMEKGNLVITLPGEAHDGMGKALNLDSGANYQFRLQGVFDTAFTPNGVAVDKDGLCVPAGGTKSDNGNGILAFTTLYAQVELYENSSVTKIGDDDKNYPGVRLDLVVDVNPESTSKVPLTEYWDMVIWNGSESRIPVQFELYRQILSEDGETVKEDWKLVLATEDYSLVPGSTTEAISWNERKNAAAGDKYETVQKGLDEQYIYRYGVHFTSVNDIPETYGLTGTELANVKKNEPKVWGDKVTLKFSLIAGPQGVLMRQFTGDINARYKDLVINGDELNEISVVYLKSGQTTAILECSRQFVDTQPPAFMESYPRFDVGSGAITINVVLDRPGKVYYVVAPVGTIPTTTGGGLLINDTNDGSEFDEFISDKEDTTRQGKITGFFTGKTGDALKTYIPRNGTERDSTFYSKYIYFKTGDNDKDRGRYGSPNYSSVIRGAYANAQKGTITYDSELVSVTVTNLAPLQEYYVYMVLEGNGDADQVVQIYRATTTKVQPPVVEIQLTTGTTPSNATVNNTGVDMTVFDADDDGKKTGSLCANPELYYALWESQSLPKIFQQVIYIEDVNGGTTATTHKKGDIYSTTDQLPSGTTAANVTMTVYDAIYKRVPGSHQTYFDQCATPAMKDDVLRYIDGRASDSTAYPTSFRSSGAVKESRKYENCYPYMNAEGAEYIMIACARNSSAGTEGSSYGFALIGSLFKPDTEPPELVRVGNYPIELGGAEPKDAKNTIWSGSLYLSFTKKLYFQEESNASHGCYEVIYGSSEAADGKIGLSKILGGSAVANTRITPKGSGSVGTSITLTVDSIREGETIELFLNGLMCNQSNYASQYRVVLTFRGQLTGKDYGETAEDYLGIQRPGFVVTLQKVR